MADGDLLGGKDAGGGVSPKRARSLGAAAAAAADVGGAPATTITAGDSDALQFLLEGLSPSPIKKVRRYLAPGGRPLSLEQFEFAFHPSRSVLAVGANGVV